MDNIVELDKTRENIKVLHKSCLHTLFYNIKQPDKTQNKDHFTLLRRKKECFIVRSFHFTAVWQTQFSELEPNKKHQNLLSVLWKVPQVNRLHAYLKKSLKWLFKNCSRGQQLPKNQTQQRGLLVQVARGAVAPKGTKSRPHSWGRF